MFKTRLHRARALLRDDLFARTGAATSEAFQFHLPRCNRVVAGAFEKISAATAGRGLEIFNANKDQLSDPDKIKPGQVLMIPQSAKR